MNRDNCVALFLAEIMAAATPLLPYIPGHSDRMTGMNALATHFWAGQELGSNTSPGFSRYEQQCLVTQKISRTEQVQKSVPYFQRTIRNNC
jgi:hypothetical protein